MESFNFILKFLSSISDAISIKYFELKLMLRFSELKFALITSFPSPELALFTESWIFSLFIANFTPSFLSNETLITLSIELINSLEGTVNDFSLDVGTTFTVGFTSAASGEFQISLGSTATRALKKGRHVYDILVSSGSTIYTIVSGNILVHGGISSAP